MGAHIVTHAHFLDAEALEDVVRGQLGGRHENCACGVRPDSAEKRGDTFRLDHLGQAVEGVAVVSALRRRESGI